MPANDLSLGTPVLEEAIDRHPLVVAPDTLLTEALALMRQARHQSCSLTTDKAAAYEILSGEARSSCVLVKQESELVGILTERDIVRLTAEEVNLNEVKMVEVMAQPVIALKEADFQDLFAPLFLFRRYRIRHLPIVGQAGQLVGVVSPESLRQVLRPTNLLKLRRVSEVMTTDVIQAPLNASVLSLAGLMAENRVSCVVITEDCAGAVRLPVGIVTERDIVQFQSLGVKISEIEATEVMSTPLFILKPSDSLWMAHQEMQQRHVRRLVVSWDWGLGLGIVTQTSLLRVFDPMEMYGVIETLQRTVEELTAAKAEVRSSEKVEKQQLREELTSQSQLLESAEPEVLVRASGGSSFDNTYHSEQGKRTSEWESLVGRLQASLNSLLNNPEMSPERRQQLLQKAVADVEGLGKLGLEPFNYFKTG